MFEFWMPISVYLQFKQLCPESPDLLIDDRPWILPIDSAVVDLTGAIDFVVGQLTLQVRRVERRWIAAVDRLLMGKQGEKKYGRYMLSIHSHFGMYFTSFVNCSHTSWDYILNFNLKLVLIVCSEKNMIMSRYVEFLY